MMFFPSIKFLILLLENEKFFKFNCCFVCSLTLIASVIQVSSRSQDMLKFLTRKEIFTGVVMSNIFNSKTDKTSLIVANIKVIKIIAIILGLLIILGLIFLFLGLANSFKKINKNQSTISKPIQKDQEFDKEIDLYVPKDAQLISSSLGQHNQILLRYLHKGKNRLVILDIKTKKIMSIITLNKDSKYFNFKID